MIREHAAPLAPIREPLDTSLGLMLAEDIVADADSPPYDKALMDGYAVQAHDPENELTVLETVTAGQVPRHAVSSGTAIRIMTGAPIPEGADAVVMQERVTRVSEDRIRLADPTLEPGQHILPLGTSMRQGDVVLRSPRAIRPVDVGVLAELGHLRPLAYPRPHVAVLATGDELVPAQHVPPAGKIRNSNGPLLSSLVTKNGCQVTDLGIASDDHAQLKKKVRAGIDHDVLLLSGGVSAGVRDFVPQLLDSLGVEKVFHKVQIKPGKPVWFGMLNQDDRRTYVFGLPGNPVSSYVCFLVFVRPLLSILSAQRDRLPQKNILAKDFHHRGDRQTYWARQMGL